MSLKNILIFSMFYFPSTHIYPHSILNFQLFNNICFNCPQPSFPSFLSHKARPTLSHLQYFLRFKISKDICFGACPAFSPLLCRKKDARPPLPPFFALFPTEFLPWWRINVSPLCKDDSYGGSATSPDGETEIGVLGYKRRNLWYHSMQKNIWRQINWGCSHFMSALEE